MKFIYGAEMRNIFIICNLIFLLTLLNNTVYTQDYFNGEIGISIDEKGRLRVHSPELGQFQIDRFSILVGGNQEEVFDYLKDPAYIDSPGNIESPQFSDIELYVSVDNHYPRTLDPPKPVSPPDVLVTINVYGWDSGGFALVKYTITNKDSVARELKPGFEILPQIDNAYGFEGIYYNSATRYLKVRRGLTSTNVGMIVLSDNLSSLTAFNWYDGYNSSDIALYNWLHSDELPENFQSDDNGLVGIISLEASTLEPGQSRTVYVGLGIGSTDEVNDILAQTETKYRSLFSSLREIKAEIPPEFALSQNYPNPFNPTTSINLNIPRTGYVLLKVYDDIGQEVSTLIDGELSAGTYIYEFDGQELASGIYYYTLISGLNLQTKKMLLLK